MHVTSPPFPPVVLPPLAPGYAWTLTPHGWCPMPYAGPPLAPMPATPPALAAPSPPSPRSLPAAPSPPAPSSTAAPPTPSPSSLALTADLLADIPPEVRALGREDGRVGIGLGDLVEARIALADARRATIATMLRYGPAPSDPAQVRTWLATLLRDRPDVLAAWRQCADTHAQSRRASQALTAAVQLATGAATPHHGPHAPPVDPSPRERPPARALTAAQLAAAAQLYDRDPAVARALTACAKAGERMHNVATLLVTALARHGPGPEETAARDAWTSAIAERDSEVAITLALTVTALDATDRAAAQLSEALAPHAARAPPRHAPSA